MSYMKKKNGFSMVEVVIALAVVLIVSATAITITIYSITTKQDEINRNEALNLTENIWNCFKAAENEDEFFALVDFSDGVAFQQKNGAYVYSPSIHEYTVRMTFDFDPASGKKSLDITALDRKGKAIVEFDYTVGGRESGA